MVLLYNNIYLCGIIVHRHVLFVYIYYMLCVNCVFRFEFFLFFFFSFFFFLIRDYLSTIDTALHCAVVMM